MSSATIIQPISCQHWQLAHQLHCTTQLNPWSEKQFIGASKGQYFNAETVVEGEFAGYFIAMQVLDEITLMDIAVTPARRGQGIGRDLLVHLIDCSRARQGQTIWLEVRASNQPALALYQTMGFEQLSVRKNYYPTVTGKEDAIIMRLSSL